MKANATMKSINSSGAMLTCGCTANYILIYFNILSINILYTEYEW